MKVLVVGGGGREHAICWKLAQSPKVTELYCAPGNGGIAQVATCVPIKATDVEAMVQWAKDNAMDFVMVAPDDPLALGMVDALEAAGIAREILDGVHSPIGLSIGAQTPAEIAVSIAAELVQERARRGPAAAPPAAGEPGVLCTITAKRGSAPRNVGTWMLVRPDGTVLGTIGGGAVEHLAVQEAKALWTHGGGPVRRHYDLTPGAAELGMVCGGDIDVEFEVRK